MKFQRIRVIEQAKEWTKTIDEARMSVKQLFQLIWNIGFIIDSLDE
jgi:hypothetical protein